MKRWVNRRRHEESSGGERAVAVHIKAITEEALTAEAPRGAATLPTDLAATIAGTTLGATAKCYEAESL
jgi:hypothetical protein